MQKAYTKINWKNKPNSSTPLGESKLVPMDAAIDEIDDRVVAFDTTKANQSDLLTCLSGVTYDSTTGVFVFTFKNGNTVTADLNIEKIPVSFSMDAYGVITMTTSDGTQYTADVGALIKTYTFSDSSEIDFTETVDGSGNKTVTASIVPGSIDGTKLTPNYLADAQAARTGAQTAATRAESWAEGGTGTRSGEDTNNSKYWAQQAQLYSSKHTIEEADGTDMPTRQNLQFDGAVTITDDSTNDRTKITITGSGHTIEDPSGTSMTQRQNLQFDGDVTVTDDSANNRTKVTVSGGGHTIWNRIKTALTQRSKLWFKDATVSDVSADGASAVEVLTSVSESDFDNLPTDGTADGIYEMNSSNITPLMADNIGYDSTHSVGDMLDVVDYTITPESWVNSSNANIQVKKIGKLVVIKGGFVPASAQTIATWNILYFATISNWDGFAVGNSEGGVLQSLSDNTLKGGIGIDAQGGMYIQNVGAPQITLGQDAWMTFNFTFVLP